MKEISASELTPGDIGTRVVVIDARGNAYAGVLTDVGATEWKYGERPEDKVRIRISVSSEERSKLELSALPLDFRLQIERPPNRSIEATPVGGDPSFGQKITIRTNRSEETR